jgi:hypothetical protein
MVDVVWRSAHLHIPITYYPKQTRDHTVLKISITEALDQAVTIRLEGQVRGLWVDELRRSCEPLLARGGGLRLDLNEVSFVDISGVALGRSLRDRNVAILHYSPFVAEQLKGYGHEDDLA